MTIWTGMRKSWGEMEGGYENNRISCYWDSDTDMTHPLILAKIPVKNPWRSLPTCPSELERLPRYAGADGSGQILVRAARRGACRHEPR